MDIQLSDLLIKGIGILLLAAVVGGFVFGIISIIRLFFKLRKLNHPKILKYYFFMIVCILVMPFSWVLNLGWYRFVLTLLAFPVVHSILFAIVNGKAMLKLFHSQKLKIYTLLSYATYMVSYLSFPDGGDYGPMYVFFGLVHNDIVARIAGVICVIGFVANIIILILQLKEIKKIKQNEGLNS